MVATLSLLAALAAALFTGAGGAPEVDAPKQTAAGLVSVAAGTPAAGDGSNRWQPIRVYFAHDKSSIDAAGLAALRTLAQALTAETSRSLLVTGHTDRSGPARYNSRLSLRRADAVRAALIAAGVVPSRIHVAGRGESNPLVITADHVREPRNRRSEITLR